MSSTQIISEAWGLYTRFWTHFASVGLTVFFVAAAIALVLAFAGPVGALLGIIVVFVASYLLTGALVTAVADVRDGRVDLTVGDTLQKAMPFLGSLLVAGVLAGLAIGLGFVAFIIPGIILATIWFLISPAIVLEGKSFWSSFGRSNNLVSGYFWPTLGVLALTMAILIVAGIVIQVILLPFPDWLASFIATLVQGAVFAPFLAIATTVTYFRLAEIKG